MKPRKPKTKFNQALFLIAFAVVLYVVMNHLSVAGQLVHLLVDLLQPLIVGGLLAFILNVPMRGLEKFFARLQVRQGRVVRERANAIFSLILTYLGGLLFIFFVAYIMIPQLIGTIPGIVSTAETAWPKFLTFLNEHNVNTTQLELLFSGFDLDPLLEKFMENYAQIIETSLSAVTSVAAVLTITITGFVISIYILSNKKKLSRQVRKLLYAYVGEKYADRTLEVAALTNQTFSSFISGQCLEAIILGLLFFITMSILRLPYALVISVFIAVTALIPYLGAFMGCVFGALLIVLVSPMKALIFLVTFFVLQQLENQLIYPKVVGNSVGLPAIWTLVSVFVGGKLFGVTGMLFFIPLTSVVYSLLRLNVNRRLEKRNLAVDSDGVHPSPPQEDQPETPAESVQAEKDSPAAP